jgi:multisubunit Na+/H+ antiporter MnhC subunit
MKGHNLPGRNAKDQTERMAKQAAAHPWVEKLARFGFVAKGSVYAVVGLLAAQTAFGAGGKKTDTQGALQTIVTQPFGKFLLGLVAIGLLGYALWRLVEAIMDPENKGTDAKGIIQRLGYAGNGLIYAALALTAVKILMGTGGGSSNTQRDGTARLLAQPFGQWLVGTIGAIVIGVGFYQFYEAYTAKFRQKFKLHEMSETEKIWATRSGRFGLAARGVVFSIIGFFLIQAARQANPNQTKGLGGALEALAQQPYGPWLLGLVAIGLIAYGFYYIAQGRYRRISTT